MDALPKIIKSIKNPLLFISRTNFKKIEMVKDLETTIPNLIDQALIFNQDDNCQNLLLKLKESFLDFNKLVSVEKRKRIEEGLNIINRIETERPLQDDDHSFGLFIEDKIKNLSTPVQYIKGVGPRIAELLKKKGINNVEDGLYFIPRDYEDRRSIKPISKAKVDHIETLKGKI